MINRANVRVVSAALIGIALLCFPACGPEDSEDPAPPPVDPARNPRDNPTSSAMHDGLAQPVARPAPATDEVWKVADRAAPGSDPLEPTCVLPSAAAALPTTATAADRIGPVSDPMTLCRAGTTGLVPVTPLARSSGGDHVQVVQRE